MDEEVAYLVNGLEACVVLQGLKSGTITLPQEFQPRRDESTVGPILILVTADSTQKDTFRSFASLEIINVDEGNDLVGLFLRLLHLCICKLHKAFNDNFDACHAGVLGDVFVLHKTLLGCAALTHVDAKLDKPKHDGF